MSKCQTCKGRGFIPKPYGHQSVYYKPTDHVECPSCKGSGERSAYDSKEAAAEFSDTYDKYVTVRTKAMLNEIRWPYLWLRDSVSISDGNKEVFIGKTEQAFTFMLGVMAGLEYCKEKA